MKWQNTILSVACLGVRMPGPPWGAAKAEGITRSKAIRHGGMKSNILKNIDVPMNLATRFQNLLSFTQL